MKVYIDYVFFINFLFDFIILLGIKKTLKRKTSIKRIILSSLFGALSIFILFINMSNLLFTSIKLLFGILMVIIAFSYKNIKYTINNFIYLMVLSILVGGFLYMINIEAGYEHVGMIFIKNNDGLNLIILILLGTLLIITYEKIYKKTKIDIKLKKEVILYINNKKYILRGYLDTANHLNDPYLNKPISIINSDINIDFTNCKVIYVPYESLNNKGIMKCFIIEKLEIENEKIYKKALVGLSIDKINIKDVDIIINERMMDL